MIRSLSHDVRVEDSDVSIKCDHEDTILRSFLRDGVGLPYECNSGACGACKIELVEGEVENLFQEAPSLSRRDIQKNKILACQSRPIKDCIVRGSISSEYIPLFMPQKFSARLVRKVSVGERLMEFTFQSEQVAEFRSGQYALLFLPGVSYPRPYSMSNVPNDKGEWQFTITKVPDGTFTKALFEQLNEGDLLEIDGPYGNAYLRPERNKDILCVGAGSGLAPMLSIVRSCLAGDEPSERKLRFYAGARTPRDIEIGKLLPQQIQSRTGFEFDITYSDEQTARQLDWKGNVGYVQEMIRSQLLDEVKSSDIYMAGPAKMVTDTVKSLMSDCGVQVDNIFYDRFF